MLITDNQTPPPKTKQAVDKQAVAAISFEKLKKERDVRVKKNKTIQLEMRIGWEKTLHAFFLFASFHTFMFINTAPFLWQKWLLGSVYVLLFVIYRSLNHFHILNLNKGELQLHKGFVKHKKITPMLRFDQLIGFGVQTYWVQKKGNQGERQRGKANKRKEWTSITCSTSTSITTSITFL